MKGHPKSLVLDAEALSGLAHADRSMLTWAAVAKRADAPLYVCAATLAEVVDGGDRDARIHRALSSARVVPVSAEVAMAAGRLRASAAPGHRKPRDLTVDALVAATALTVPSPVVVLTSNTGDLVALLADTGIKVESIS